MSKKNIAAATLSLLLIAGCANEPYQPVPAGSTEPSALVADTLKTLSGSRAQAFIVQSVDGHRIANAIDASLGASRGQGPRLSGQDVVRPLPVRAMQLTLEARDIAAMPIAALFGNLSGHYHAVEGVVSFTPTAGHHYVVTGTLAKEGSAVWIEDVDSHEAVTEKVTTPAK